MIKTQPAPPHPPFPLLLVHKPKKSNILFSLSLSLPCFRTQVLCVRCALPFPPPPLHPPPSETLVDQSAPCSRRNHGLTPPLLSLFSCCRTLFFSSSAPRPPIRGASRLMNIQCLLPFLVCMCVVNPPPICVIPTFWSPSCCFFWDLYYVVPSLSFTPLLYVHLSLSYRLLTPSRFLSFPPLLIVLPAPHSFHRHTRLSPPHAFTPHPPPPLTLPTYSHTKKNRTSQVSLRKESGHNRRLF